MFHNGGGGHASNPKGTDTALDISSWSTSAGCKVDCALAQELLFTISHLAKVSYFLVVVSQSFECTDISWVSKANSLCSFRAALNAGLHTVHNLSTKFADLPLSRTKSYMVQWLRGVDAFINELSIAIVDGACASVSTASAIVDSSSPRWGSAISDDELRDDSARLLLLANPKVAQLPHECRTLQSALEALVKVSDLLLNKSVDQIPACAEVARFGNSALAFGKRTVNIAAACKILFVAPSAKGLSAVLQWKASMPQSLVIRLESALQNLSSEPPAVMPAPAQTASPPAPTASSASGSGYGKGLKRARSGVGLGGSSRGASKKTT